MTGFMKFREIIKKKKVITVELNPPKGTDTSHAFLEIKKIKPYIDAVNITDSPMAKMRMSPIALSCILRQKLNVETIFNLTCRDRNILGLQAELLGASAMGVENILAIYGDPPKIGDHPQARPVYEVNTLGLIKIAATLNKGRDLAGNKLDKPTDFFIGCAVNPGAQDLKKEIKKLAAKVMAGAHFALTQPVYDLAVLKKFLSAAKNIKIPIIIGVLPLKSLKFAQYLNQNVPGIHIPEKFLALLEKTPAEDQAGLGLKLALEFMEQATSLVHGFHLMSGGQIAGLREFLKKNRKNLK